MAKKEDYHKPQKVELWLSQSDIDIITYAINHINWDEYDANDYDGEDIGAACIHLDDIEDQIEHM